VLHLKAPRLGEIGMQLSQGTLHNLPLTLAGMVMAVKLVHHPASNSILVLSGYEGGLTAIHLLPSGEASNVQSAQLLYLSQPHTQPILSLDVAPDTKTYYTSSADALIAAHIIPNMSRATEATDRNTGQYETYPVTGDEVLSTPRPTSDKPGEVSSSAQPYSNPKETPPVPLQSTSLSFTKQPVAPSRAKSVQEAGLSSLLSTSTSQAKTNPHPPAPTLNSIQSPYKTINTKHSGQQSLRVRSDGRLFATGGWDSRIRVYSCKTLKEVAALKWHKEGVYAIDFAQVLAAENLGGEEEDKKERAMTQTGLQKLQRQREEQMQLKHWIVAGAKDGKVSIWEVF
jgi:WD40 repeat protein